jgi:hypothetical protein
MSNGRRAAEQTTDDIMRHTMGRWLDIGAAIFAFIAAVFWFLSAARKLPPMLAYWDKTPDSDPFYQAVKFSARMNVFAAAASGVSAALIAIRLFFFPM